MYGKEGNAMSEAAIRGLEVFRMKGRCVDCHTIGQTSATFTDNKFHNLGVGFSLIEDRLSDIVDRYLEASEAGSKKPAGDFLTPIQVSELGRFAVTLNPSDLGRFKTPTLRNIAVTAPYMHDGSVETLEEVVELYNAGGEENPMLDGGIKPLRLTEQEKADLVEFMKALTSPEFTRQ
jgi:cytochrome c peroxidase